MNTNAEHESPPLKLDRTQRLAVAVLALVLLACCGAALALSAGRPISVESPPGNAPYQVNLNRASWSELCLVPGLGEVISKRIVEHRAQHGLYESVDELLAIQGIGRIKLEQLRPYLVLDDGFDTR